MRGWQKANTLTGFLFSYFLFFFGLGSARCRFWPEKRFRSISRRREKFEPHFSGQKRVHPIPT